MLRRALLRARAQARKAEQKTLVHLPAPGTPKASLTSPLSSGFASPDSRPNQQSDIEHLRAALAEAASPARNAGVEGEIHCKDVQEVNLKYQAYKAEHPEFNEPLPNKIRCGPCDKLVAGPRIMRAHFHGNLHQEKMRQALTRLTKRHTPPARRPGKTHVKRVKYSSTPNTGSVYSGHSSSSSATATFFFKCLNCNNKMMVNLGQRRATCGRCHAHQVVPAHNGQ